MAAWTKSAGFRDLVATTTAVLAIGSGGLIALALWRSRADLSAMHATWYLAVGLLAWSLCLVVSIAVVSTGYEMAWPFAPSSLMGLAAANLLLGVQVWRLGVIGDFFLLALPFLVVPPLVWLSHVIREMRHRCIFCEGSWRTRLHLVAGGALTVCDLCVKAAAAAERPPLDATVPRVTCGVCAAHLPGDQFPLRRDPAAMCASCVELARQVIAEGVGE